MAAVAAAMLADADEQEDLLGDGTPRNAIVACWHRFEVQAASAGATAAGVGDLSEFTLRLLDLVEADASAVAELPTLFREARFSEHELGEDDRAVALDALRRIHRDLRTPAQPGPCDEARRRAVRRGAPPGRACSPWWRSSVPRPSSSTRSRCGSRCSCCWWSPSRGCSLDAVARGGAGLGTPAPTAPAARDRSRPRHPGLPAPAREPPHGPSSRRRGRATGCASSPTRRCWRATASGSRTREGRDAARTRSCARSSPGPSRLSPRRSTTCCAPIEEL